MGALQAVPVRSKDSILGSNDADVTRPVETDAALSHRGLLNNGANHCFLNVVIQAVSLSQCLMFRGLFLYNVDFEFIVECCIRQVWYSCVMCNTTSIAYNHYTDIYS